MFEEKEKVILVKYILHNLSKDNGGEISFYKQNGEYKTNIKFCDSKEAIIFIRELSNIGLRTNEILTNSMTIHKTEQNIVLDIESLSEIFSLSSQDISYLKYLMSIKYGESADLLISFCLSSEKIDKKWSKGLTALHQYYIEYSCFMKLFVDNIINAGCVIKKITNVTQSQKIIEFIWDSVESKQKTLTDLCDKIAFFNCHFPSQMRYFFEISEGRKVLIKEEDLIKIVGECFFNKFSNDIKD